MASDTAPVVNAPVVDDAPPSVALPVPDSPAVQAAVAFTDALLPVYVVSNPTSGGNLGGQLMALGVRDLHLNNPEYLVRIFDIRQGASGAKPAFESLKRDLARFPAAVIRVIVAGGDGTVLWALSEIEKHGIPSDRVAVGHLPFGTGNDFSRATGFGGTTGSLTGRGLRGLKDKVELYSKRDFVTFDLWDVEIRCGSSEGGGIYQIKQGKKTPVNSETGTFHKVMGNYFSLGVESRIGLGFDRNRTQSQACNKCVYICEGTKKMFSHTARVDEVLQALYVEQPTTTPGTEEKKTQEIFGKHKKNGAASMVFLNIPSISGGADLWRHSNAREPKAPPTEGGQAGTGGLQSKKQSISDKQLEVVTVPSIFAFGRAQVPLLNSGVGTRVAQSGGPYELVFKPELSREIRTYMQIDGEFFQVNKPLSVRINWRRHAQVIVNATPNN